MRALIAHLLIAVALLGQATPKEGDDLMDSQSVIRFQIVPRQELTARAVVRGSKDFLSKMLTQRLKVLTMYSDASTAAEEFLLCEGYNEWNDSFEKLSRRQFRAAHLISIGDDSVLWVRGEDGAVTRQVLGGNDPTKFDVDGVRFEVLFVSGKKRTKFEKCGTPGAIDPLLYLKTKGRLSAKICQKATERLAKKLGSRYLWVDFRNDEWFRCDRFPVFYPFSPEAKPAEAAYLAAPQFTCFVDCDGRPSCGLTSGSLM